MRPSSSTVSAPAAVPRAVLDRIAEPIRLQLAPEQAEILDLLVTLAASAPVAANLPARELPSHGPCLAELLGATSWDQLRITVADGHTVRIGCGKRVVRRTYGDLGLHGAASRNPTRKWAMLLAICAGHGTFRWQAFGDFHAVSQAMSVLRRALQGAIGLPGDPFHAWDSGWKARFFASSEIADG